MFSLKTFVNMEIKVDLPPRLLILAQPGEQLADIEDELLKATWESPDTSGSSHFSEKKRQRQIHKRSLNNDWLVFLKIITDYITNFKICDTTFSKRSEFRQLDFNNSKDHRNNLNNPLLFKSMTKCFIPQGLESDLPSQNREGR